MCVAYTLDAAKDFPFRLTLMPKPINVESNRDLANEFHPLVAEHLESMLDKAWEVRNNAYLLDQGRTKVGCVALSEDAELFAGTNIQHQYRSHDIHAEVAAISALVSSGGRKLVGVVVVAERELFTPCGACMDWIFQLGGADCFVGVQAARSDLMKVYTARELMPYYPR